MSGSIYHCLLHWRFCNKVKGDLDGTYVICWITKIAWLGKGRSLFLTWDLKWNSSINNSLTIESIEKRGLWRKIEPQCALKPNLSPLKIE